MKKSNFTGWKNVFHFEFQQATKQKAFLVFLILFCAVALFLKPVMRLIKDNEKVEPVEINTFYVCDESGLQIAFDKMELGEKYANTKIEVVDQAFVEQYSNDIEAAAEKSEKIHEKDVCADIKYEQEKGIFTITFYKAAKTDYSKKECEGLKDAFVEEYTSAKMTAIDVNEEQMTAISAPVETEVLFADINGKEIIEEEKSDTSVNFAGYTVMLVGIMIITMLVSTCGSQIATSIVIEKSSKVIEYMMTNIRPMALITGKMLSVLATTLIQFAAVGICYLVSSVATDVIFGSGAESVAQTVETATAESSSIMDVLSNINIGVIGAILLLWVFGILFYCMIAGLCGASASKLDELGEALKVFQLMMLIGSYGGIAVCMMMLTDKGAGALLTAACIFPVTAPYVAPAAMIMGKISIVFPLIGLILLILVSIGLFGFTSKTFEALIFYNGKVLKLKDILAMSKKKKVAKEGK